MEKRVHIDSSVVDGITCGIKEVKRKHFALLVEDEKHVGARVCVRVNPRSVHACAVLMRILILTV